MVELWVLLLADLMAETMDPLMAAYLVALWVVQRALASVVYWAALTEDKLVDQLENYWVDYLVEV